MRIKKIEVNGFKSFADRQVVVVDDRVTSIIGPNGCGKSNIVDAIRWCLGEQRAKHLRGSGMGDVIFAGSSTRGPAGMAEVTITFENGGDIPPPWSAYAEIGVTRRLYRDGTSEYLVNKVPCRLRDITELLMGTGVGRSGYSIIEQGRVGQIVTSKPETRRQIIDEAAGITKFKLQKADAQRRIEQTRQNLLRVSDVLGELEVRLGTLRKQAAKAERYKAYRSELTDLELWIASHQYLEFLATRRVLADRATDLGEQVDALRSEYEVREARIEAARIVLTESTRRLQDAQEKMFGLENRISLLEQERRHKLGERDALTRSNESSSKEVEVVRGNLVSLEAELERTSTALGELGKADDETSPMATERAAARAHDEAREAARKAEQALGGLRSDAQRNASALAAAEARLASKRDSVVELETRLAGLREEAATVEASAPEAGESTEAAQAAVVEREAAIAALRAERAELDRERVTLREQIRAVEVEVETSRKELLRTRSRLQSLEEIQQRYTGCASGVQVVMEHREALAERALGIDGSLHASDPHLSSTLMPARPEVLGIMADFLSAPAHLEPAVGAVLGERLQGIVVDGPSTGASGVELLKELREGRTAFLPRACRGERGVANLGDPGVESAAEGTLLGFSPSSATTSFGAIEVGAIEVVDLTTEDGAQGTSAVAPAAMSGVAGLEARAAGTGQVAAATPAPVLEGEGVLGRLVDLVQVEPAMRPLAEVLLGDAVVVESLSRALSLWAKGGVAVTLVTPDGDRVEPSGVVVGGSSDAIDSALLQRKREIKELQEIEAQLAEAFDAVRGRQQALESRMRDVEEGRERSEGDVLAAEKARMAAKQELDAMLRAAEQRRRDRERVQEQVRRAEVDLANRVAEVERLDVEAKACAERVPALQEALAAAEEAGREAAVTRDRAAEALSAARVELARWQQERDSLVATKSRLEKQAASERDRVRRIEATIVEANERMAALEAEVEAIVTEHDQRLVEHKHALAEKQDAVEAHDAARVDVDRLDLETKNLRRELDEQREALSEVEMGLRELDMQAGHLQADVRERHNLELVEILVDFHHRALATEVERERVRELKRVISRMGDVNLTAIEEYEDVAARFETLSAQKIDLEQATNELQEAIDRIDATTRDRFKDTFEQVNEMFKRVFPRLFSGGQAELVMTQPDDLLETGVDILAQPPGKKVASLELLSGGEKALTAVSLVFAIFLIKPSPFCLLDEVDAPLDEANVGRFCDLVRELSERNQFIIITHNKRTMETADRLYGVTMEQKGVSKLVSVNLRRATASAAYAPN